MRTPLVATLVLAAGHASALTPLPVCGDTAYYTQTDGHGVISFEGRDGYSWANCADRRAFMLARSRVTDERLNKAEHLFHGILKGPESLNMLQIAQRMRDAGVPVRDYRLPVDSCVCADQTMARAMPMEAPQ